MKICIKLTQVLAFSLFIGLVSCSDDDDDAPPSIEVSNFSVTVDENQAADTVLGTVAATGTDGVFAYSIASQSPAGSIAIDAATGEITVADASSFDFETNPTITALLTLKVILLPKRLVLQSH